MTNVPKGWGPNKHGHEARPPGGVDQSPQSASMDAVGVGLFGIVADALYSWRHVVGIVAMCLVVVVMLAQGFNNATDRAGFLRRSGCLAVAVVVCAPYGLVAYLIGWWLGRPKKSRPTKPPKPSGGGGNPFDHETW